MTRQRPTHGRYIAPSLQEIAKRLARVEKRQRDRTPQLTSSSIEDGALLEYDRDGNLTQIIGKQHDSTHGSFGVNGPLPPTPAGLNIDPVPGGLDIYWDGTFEGGEVAPMNFHRVDIVVGLEDDYDTQNAPPVASISSPRGGKQFVALAPLEQFVVLRTVNQSGKTSLPSVMASDVPLNVGEPEPDPAPTTSPTPQIVRLPDMFLVKFPPMLHADEVLVYIGTSTPLPIDETTYHGTATGTTYAIDTEADGTPLEPDTTYYVALMARNVTGDAPASPEDSATILEGVSDEALAALASDLSDLETELGTLDTTVAGLGTSLTTLGSDLDSAESAITGLGTDLTGLQTDLTGLETEVGGILPITETDLADGAVVEAKIAALAVVAGKIAANAVTANTIAADAVTANKIAADAVIAAKIAAGAVIAEKIQAGAVETDKLAAEAVVAGKIAAEAIISEKIAAGAILAEHIEAEQITAEHVVADFISAFAIEVGQLTGGTFDLTEGEVNVIQAVGSNGSKVVMDGAKGFYMTGPEEIDGEQGPMLIEFPINGNPNIISGILEAGTLTVNAGSTLRGTTEIAPGGQVLLAGQIQPPVNAPSLNSQDNYFTVQHDPFGFDASALTQAGLTKGHDGYWYSVMNDGWWRKYDGTGALVGSASVGDWSIWEPIGGIVYASHHGGRYYILARRYSDSMWAVEARDTSFALIKRTLHTDSTVPDFNGGASSKLPALGWDHTNGRLLMAYWYSGGGGSIQIYPRSVDAAGVMTNQSGWFSPSGFSYPYDLAYVARGTFDYGADRYIFRANAAAGGDEAFKVFNTVQPNAVRQAGDEWNRASATYVVGAWWDGTHFWSMNRVGTRVRYAGGDMMWSGTTTPDGMFEIKHTWYDSDNVSTRPESVTTTSGSNQVVGILNHFDNGDIGSPVSGTGIPGGATITAVAHGVSADTVTISANATATGAITLTVTSKTHETTPSPAATIYMLKRQRVTATFGTIPGVGGHNDPNAAKIYMRRTTSGTWACKQVVLKPKTAWTYDHTVTAPGGTPPVSNTFPFLSMSKLKATSGGFEVNANSDGSVGTGTFRNSVDARADARIAAAPRAKLRRSSTLSIPNNAITAVAWNETSYESVSTFGDQANNRLVAPEAGIYWIAAYLEFVANATGRRELRLFINGALRFQEYKTSILASTVTPLNLSVPIQLSAGDLITVSAYQNSGGALNLNPDSFLSAEWRPLA